MIINNNIFLGIILKPFILQINNRVINIAKSISAAILPEKNGDIDTKKITPNTIR